MCSHPTRGPSPRTRARCSPAFGQRHGPCVPGEGQAATSSGWDDALMNASRAGAWRRWPLLVLPLLALALALTACDFDAPQSTLRPPGSATYAGYVADKQAWLFWFTMLLAAIVFVLV